MRRRAHGERRTCRSSKVTVLITMTAILAQGRVRLRGPTTIALGQRRRVRSVRAGLCWRKPRRRPTPVRAHDRRKLTATRVYLRWDSSFPNQHLEWLKRRNRTIVLSVRAMREDDSIVPWRSIADAEEGPNHTTRSSAGHGGSAHSTSTSTSSSITNRRHISTTPWAHRPTSSTHGGRS